MSEKKTNQKSSASGSRSTVKCPHCGNTFPLDSVLAQKGAGGAKSTTLGIWLIVAVVLAFLGWLLTPKPEDARTDGHPPEMASADTSADMGEMPPGHPPIDGGMEGMMNSSSGDGASSGMPGGHPTVEGNGPMPDDVMQKFNDLKAKVETNPGDTDSLKELGNMYYDIGWADKAIEYYGKYLALVPDDPFVLNDIGRMYIAMDDLDSATKNLNRSIELNPEMPQPYINLGLAYAGLGKYEEAKAILQKAVSIATDESVKEGAQSLLNQIESAMKEENKVQ